MLKVGLISLGCAKNSVDSEVIMGLLKQEGYQITEREELADILIVNTCGFINSAKEESVNAILDAAEYKKKGSCKALVVAGCLAQRYKDELLAEIPEIDGLIGTGEIPRIANVVREAVNGERSAHVNTPDFIYDHEMPRILSTPGYTAYVKVADGCDNRCTYCAIPGIRGGYRSRPMESVSQEVSRLSAGGVREINLIAQDTTRYGFDLYGDYKLDKLLTDLVKIDDIAWIRVLYAYPTHFTDKLIEVMAHSEKICKYLDIPLQHADDKILKAMNRRGSNYDILKLIEKLRSSIPGLAIRTSFIVGFPGETEESFENLVDFVKSVRFDRMGVFTYSPEEGTPAAELPGQVPEEVKEARRDILMKIQQEISLEINKSKIEKTIDVLIEGKDHKEKELYVGRTQFDAPDVDGSVFVRGNGLQPGDIVPVKITHAYEYDLIGEVINESS
ncbi:MAG TPA: 30S ribosomal protein S12 methylthiotransferase RimO [Desulfobacteria bacterium]|nr:30S ribosomal protein S12 methylthiotransferase RimO [Desulfobacteria bacterium]